MEFDPSGNLLKSFGVGLFAYPHGFTIDRDGNLWVSDVNDESTVLGMSAKNEDGVVRGQEVLKLSPTGRVLMMIGKVGASFHDPTAKKGELRGIVVGNAKDGSLKAFIPDPADPDKLDIGTSASGIAADEAGNIYAADVAAHNLRKYVKFK